MLQMPKVKRKTRSAQPKSKKKEPEIQVPDSVVESITNKIWSKLEEKLASKSSDQPPMDPQPPPEPIPSTSAMQDLNQAAVANAAIAGLLGETPVNPGQGKPFLHSSTPLGSHVPPKLRTKILANQFVELHQLLPDSCQESSDDEDFPKRHRKKAPKAQKLSITEFTTAFNSLIAIRAEKFPQDVCGMLKHAQTVQTMHCSFGPDAWHFYDRQFRLAKQHDSSMAWEHLDVELYTQAVAIGLKVRHIKSAPAPPQSNKGFRPNTCWSFQQHGKCRRLNCRFFDTHHCYICRGPHATSNCNKQQINRQTNQPFRAKTSAQRQPSKTNNHVNQ